MSSGKRKISILYLEDNPDDVELLKIVLEKSSIVYDLQVVSNKQDFEKTFEKGFDVIIADYNLKAYDGLAALKTVRATFDYTPIIILSGTIGEELAVDLLRQGANDFILKSNLQKISIAIERARTEGTIKKEKTLFQRELLEKNLILDTFFNNLNGMFFLKGRNRRYVKVNEAFCQFAKLRMNEIIGKAEIEIFPEVIATEGIANDNLVAITEKPVTYDIDFVDTDGKRKILEIHKTPIIDKEGLAGIIGECRDVTRQRLLIEEIHQSQSMLTQAEMMTDSGSFEYNSDLDTLQCSANLKKMLALAPNMDTISFRKFTQIVKNEDRPLLIEGVNEAINNRSSYNGEHRFKWPEQEKEIQCRVLLRSDPYDEKKFFGILQNVTEQHRSEISIIEKQENDRKEIARELHDNLGQKLSAVSMFVSKISDDSPENKDLVKVKELAHEAIDDLGYLLNTISVKQVEEHSLEYSLERLINYVPDTIKIESVINYDEASVSDQIKNQIFRITQEVLNNTIKYSDATEFNLLLSQEDYILTLRLKDNGKGFDMNNIDAGNGLKNITYRVQKSNGLINIQSQPGEGTDISIKLPVK